MFHSLLLLGVGWILCVVSSLFTTSSFWLACRASTCGLYWQPFCSRTAGCCGDWKLCEVSPSETYTTTFAKPPPVPTTTSSVVAGVGWALAQSGSCDMSMRVGLGGVPSNFTMPFREEGSSAGPAQPCNVQKRDK